jgi:hypothetical protein
VGGVEGERGTCSVLLWLYTSIENLKIIYTSSHLIQVITDLIEETVLKLKKPFAFNFLANAQPNSIFLKIYQ